MMEIDEDISIIEADPSKCIYFTEIKISYYTYINAVFL